MNKLPPITVLTKRQRDMLVAMRELHAVAKGDVTLAAIAAKMGLSKVVVFEHMKALVRHGFVTAISRGNTRSYHKYVPVVESPLGALVTTAVARLHHHGDTQLANELETAFGGNV